MTGAPVRYDPSLGHVAPDEAETRDALIATMRSIAESDPEATAVTPF